VRGEGNCARYVAVGGSDASESGVVGGSSLIDESASACIKDMLMSKRGKYGKWMNQTNQGVSLVTTLVWLLTSFTP